MEIRQSAQKLAEKFYTNNPQELCKALHIHVMECALCEMRGYFYQNQKGKIIVLNEALDEVTRRFVLAHELGHYVLHGGLNRVFLDTSTYLNTAKYEKEANLFASYLLFPEDEVFLQCDFTLSQLASLTGLSEAVVALRLAKINP